jgi:hypothetical protein
MTKSVRRSYTETWIKRGSSLVVDGDTVEIDRLLKEELEHVASTDNGWTQLFVDARGDGYWELSFPQSNTHGGGPRLLSPVSRDLVQSKYGI